MTGKAEDMVTLTGTEQDGTEQDGTEQDGTEQDGTDGDLSATAAPATGDLIVTENSEMSVYEAVLGDEIVAGVVYSKAGSRVTLLATSVFPAYRGKGVAARLLSGVLDKLRARGETATVTCPFAAAFVSAHPEYADVLDPAIPGHRLGHGH